MLTGGAQSSRTSAVMPIGFRLLLGVLLLESLLAADGTVSFNNNNLGTPRPVTFDSSWGALAGTGVRNGVADGKSFVAKLLFADSGVQIGAAANFRAATTTSPGTWSGGTRTIVGVPLGTPVMLKVVVTELGSDRVLGESAPFLFRDPLSKPPLATDDFMVEFQGFSIHRTGSSGSVVVNPSVKCPGEAGPITIPVREGETASLSPEVDPVTAELVRLAPKSLEVGKWSGVYPNMEFASRLGFYGTSSFEVYYSLGAGVTCSRTVNLEVAPNVARFGPQLRADPRRPGVFSLLGLVDRSYRIQTSTDLVNWFDWGTKRGSLSALELDMAGWISAAGRGCVYVRALNP